MWQNDGPSPFCSPELPFLISKMVAKPFVPVSECVYAVGWKQKGAADNPWPLSYSWWSPSSPIILGVPEAEERQRQWLWGEENQQDKDGRLFQSRKGPEFACLRIRSLQDLREELGLQREGAECSQKGGSTGTAVDLLGTCGLRTQQYREISRIPQKPPRFLGDAREGKSAR